MRKKYIYLSFLIPANGRAIQDSFCAFKLFGGMLFSIAFLSLFILFFWKIFRWNELCINVVSLHLQTARFRQFWDEVSKSRNIVEVVPGILCVLIFVIILCSMEFSVLKFDWEAQMESSGNSYKFIHIWVNCLFSTDEVERYMIC